MKDQMPIHETPHEKIQFLNNLIKRFPSSTSTAQRQRVEAALRHSPTTVKELQRYASISDPRPRVHELRHGDGLNIGMVFVLVLDESGEKQRSGMYFLQSGETQ